MVAGASSTDESSAGDSNMNIALTFLSGNLCVSLSSGQLYRKDIYSQQAAAIDKTRSCD